MVGGSPHAPAVLIVRSLRREDLGYYLNGPAAGRWTGAACADLGLQGSVEGRALRRVLSARHPRHAQLLTNRPDTRRRDAWGLIFAAPKSLSLVSALSPPDVASLVGEAHQRAVASALGHLERYGMWAGRGSGGRKLIPVTGMIGAAFDHDHNALHEPHLHTHVLVANLVEGDDGRWSAFRSRPWWAERRAASALYQLGLRYELAQFGLPFEWHQHPNGLADVEGVPRRSVEAVSRRHFLIQSDATRWTGELTTPSRRVLAVAQGRTHREAPGAAATVTASSWPEQLRSTGFGADEAQRLVEQARARERPSIVEPGREQIAQRLLDVGSTFRRADVVCAIAELARAGVPGALVESSAERFCAQAQPVAPGRWTTPEATRLEEMLAEHVARGRGQGRGQVQPELARAVLSEVSADGPGAAWESAWRLVTAGHRVELVDGASTEPGAGSGRERAAGCLLGQAEVIDLARRAWQAAGHRVVVLADAPAVRRWEALAAIGPGPPDRASVLVVDRADRIPPPRLLDLLGQADRQGAKVVLVDGGTAPARRWAAAMTLREWPSSLGPVRIGSNRVPERPAGTWVTGGGAATDGVRIQVAGTGRDALASLIEAWAQSDPAVGGLPPVLVGLGAAEVAGLNRAARDRWLEAGRLGGPPLRWRGQELRPGDLVMATRSVGAASHPARPLEGVTAGTRGRITAVDPRRRRLHITWYVPVRRSVAGAEQRAQPAARAGSGSVRLVAGQLAGDQLSRLSYGYATTPSYLRSSGEPVLILGRPSSAGPHRPRVRGAWLTAPTSIRDPVPSEHALDAVSGSPGPGARHPGRVSALARHSLAELASQRNALSVQLRAAQAGEPPGADRLIAWRDLVGAETYRSDLLAWSREIRAAEGLDHELGPPPEAPAQRAAWRRVIRQLAVFEDRWPVGAPTGGAPTGMDRPDTLERAADYQADLNRLQQGRRQLEYWRERSDEPTHRMGLGGPGREGREGREAPHLHF